MTTTELFVIVSAATGDPLWAAVTWPEVAEREALKYAVNTGNCNLLSGSDLVAHLAGARVTALPTLRDFVEPGDTYRDFRQEH